LSSPVEWFYGELILSHGGLFLPLLLVHIILTYTVEIKKIRALRMNRVSSAVSAQPPVIARRPLPCHGRHVGEQAEASDAIAKALPLKSHA
jgi:hypothetical protein